MKLVIHVNLVNILVAQINCILAVAVAVLVANHILLGIMVLEVLLVALAVAVKEEILIAGVVVIGKVNQVVQELLIPMLSIYYCNYIII